MSQLPTINFVRLKGMLGDKNASAVAFWKDRVLVVTDEATELGNIVQMFEPDGADYHALPGSQIVLDAPGGDGQEMDLEGIAVDGETVYVLGSHSSKRKKTDASKAYAKNRAALLSVPEAEPSRDVLLRFDLDANGKAGPIQRSSLRAMLSSTEPFKSFGTTASKENGVDAEGLAVLEGWLYVGFRGPVLRGNFTPIVRCKFAVPVTEFETLFVDLGGRGVRDLTQVEAGLLILAGPVGDGPGSYQLYLWNGRDGVPGKNRPAAAGSLGLQLIGELPTPTPDTGEAVAAKPEGLALVTETSNHWDLLVVYDGLEDGHATRFHVKKP